MLIIMIQHVGRFGKPCRPFWYIPGRFGMGRFGTWAVITRGNWSNFGQWGNFSHFLMKIPGNDGDFFQVI